LLIVQEAEQVTSRNPTTPASATWRGLFCKGSASKTIVLAAGVALHAVNVYIVTTILPSVVKDIGGLPYYAWNTTLFVVAAIIGSAIAAELELRSGPKASYWLALGAFSVGSAICALAPLMAWLLIGRFIQGLGGGLLFALSYSLIRTLFPPSLWTRAMALVSGMWGGATLCGPAIGGVLAQVGSWRHAFWVLLPACALLAILAGNCLPKGAAEVRRKQGFPLVQLMTLVTSVGLISVAGVIEQTSWKIPILVCGMLLIVPLPKMDKRPAQRLLPEGAYTMNRALGQIYMCIALLMIALSAEIFVPYFLQSIQGHSALLSGYLTASMAAGWTIASLISSSANEIWAKRAVRTGPLIVTAASISLAVLLPKESAAFGYDFWITCLALLATGFGVGMGWPHLLARILDEAPAGQENLAAASITTVQLYATALGAAIAGLIANAAGLADPGGKEGATLAAFWLFLLLSLPALVAGWIANKLSRRPIHIEAAMKEHGA